MQLKHAVARCPGPLAVGPPVCGVLRACERRHPVPCHNTVTCVYVCALAAWEPTWLAMGHALRRLRHFDRSAEAIRTALLLVPGRAASRTALAFTLHCQARLLCFQLV